MLWQRRQHFMNWIVTAWGWAVAEAVSMHPRCIVESPCVIWQSLRGRISSELTLSLFHLHSPFYRRFMQDWHNGPTWGRSARRDSLTYVPLINYPINTISVRYSKRDVKLATTEPKEVRCASTAAPTLRHCLCSQRLLFSVTTNY
jgi:hypothetical protein